MDRLLFLEVFSFFIIAIILGGILYMLRGKRKNVFLKSKAIEEIDRFYYMPKVFLSAVKIENGYFILGITENGINLIKEITEESEIENLRKELSVDGNNFKFRSFFSMNKKNEMEEIKSRLKKMRHEEYEK